MKDQYLECGKIINTHGVNGMVKLECYCDTPKVLAKLPCLFFKKGNGYTGRRVLRASIFRSFVLMHLEGVDSLEDAILLKGQTVFALRDDIPLPQGHYFVADLIGLPLIDADTGRVYGHITEINPSPASDLYTVKTPSGKEVLFPAVKAFVTRTDPTCGVFVRPIPGMFDPEGE